MVVNWIKWWSKPQEGKDADRHGLKPLEIGVEHSSLAHTHTHTHSTAQHSTTHESTGCNLQDTVSHLTFHTRSRCTLANMLVLCACSLFTLILYTQDHVNMDVHTHTVDTQWTRVQGSSSSLKSFISSFSQCAARAIWLRLPCPSARLATTYRGACPSPIQPSGTTEWYYTSTAAHVALPTANMRQRG